MEERTYFESFVNVCHTPEEDAFNVELYESLNEQPVL